MEDVGHPVLDGISDFGLSCEQGSDAMLGISRE